MRVRVLLLVLSGAAANVAFAGAGLTSVGVTSNQNPAADEPTLAQVAPVTGTANAAVGGATASNAAGANPAAVGGPTAVTGNGANAAPVATTRVVTPPPPPDPATLPVSVIRPLTKPATGAAEPESVAPAPATQPQSPNALARDRAAGPTPGEASKPAAPPLAPQTARPAPIPRRTEAPARGMATETPPPAETTPDGSSSSFIFYTGSGLAGAILLLSIGAFLRSRAAEPAARG